MSAPDEIRRLNALRVEARGFNKADDLRCRNLYRAACGLPTIRPGVQIEIGVPLQLYYNGGN